MIEYRDFGGDPELNAQRSLYTRAFPEQKGQVPGSEAYYRWKFRGFPAEPRSLEYAAYAPEGVVGYYAAIPFRYRIGGVSRVCGMVCDVMTDPAMQGKGIFTGLGRYSLARLKSSGIDFVSGYPIRPAVLPGHLKVGWKVAFELPMYIRPLRANALLRSKKLGPLAPLVNPLLGLRNAVVSKRVAPGLELCRHRGGNLKTCSRIPEFLTRFAGEVPNFLEKTLEFYDWRLSAPGFEYTVLELKRGPDCVGLAIARRTELHGVPSLAILDLMVLKAEREAGLPALHHALAELARETAAEVLVIMMSAHRAREYRLSSYAFLKSPFLFRLILNRLNPEIEEAAFLNEQNWHLMWIDSDDL